jgi:hypothetical protein
VDILRSASSCPHAVLARSDNNTAAKQMCRALVIKYRLRIVTDPPN